MRKKQSGSIALAILLTFFMVLSGTFFVNSAVARDTLKPENIRAEIDASGLTGKVERRIGAASEGLEAVAKEIVESSEFNQLLDRYSEYISEYLLSGSTDKQISNQELSNLVSSYIKKQASGLEAAGDLVDRMVEGAVKAADLSSIFARIDQAIPEPAGGLMLFALNRVTCLVCLGLTILFLVLLLFAARPRRLLGFAGAGVALIGVGTIYGSDFMVSIFGDVSSNDVVTSLLSKYGEAAASLGTILAIAGAAALVVGILIAIVTGRISRNRYW